MISDCESPYLESMDFLNKGQVYLFIYLFIYLLFVVNRCWVS